MKKVAGLVLAGAMVVGTGMTTYAAEPDSVPTRVRERTGEKARQELTPEQKEKREALRGLRQEFKETRERVGAEKEELKGKLGPIQVLVKELRQDEEKNRNALEKARVDLRELHLIHGDVKAINEKLLAAREALKAAREEQDAAKAIATVRHILSLMHTKLDLLKAANVKAAQAIAHLKGAAQGNGN